MRCKRIISALFRASPYGGFTLIELAVTALVLSIGILASFAFLRIGIIAKTDAADDFRVLSFAHDTITTLRTISAHEASSLDINDWYDFWTKFTAGETNIPIISISSEEECSNDHLVAANPNDDDWRIYRFPGADTNHVVLYRFDILVTNSMDGVFSDASIMDRSPTNRIDISLRVKSNAAPLSQEQLFFTSIVR